MAAIAAIIIDCTLEHISTHSSGHTFMKSKLIIIYLISGFDNIKQ